MGLRSQISERCEQECEKDQKGQQTSGIGARGAWVSLFGFVAFYRSTHA